ncbi:MAG: DUF58 domain-containing protein [Cyanobacteria bacterium P01_H01_bin.121]
MLFTLRFYLFWSLSTAIALLVATWIGWQLPLIGLLLFDGLLLGVAIADSWRSRQRRVTVERALAPRLSIGRDNPVSLTVQTGDYPAELQLHDRHPTENVTITGLPLSVALTANSQQELHYTAHPTRRGHYEWGQIQVRQRSPWGLVWHSWAIAQPQQTQVYPDLIGLRELTIRLTLQSAGSIQRARQRGIGTESAELREYDLGDDPRLIDWKATARRGRPLVRVLEPEQEQVLIILLDRGRLMTAQVQGLRRFDWGLNTALALALTGLNRGDRVGMGVFDRDLKLWMPPERGQAHLTTLIERLTPIEPELLEPDYLGVVSQVLRYQTRRALVVIITELVDAIASTELLAALSRLSPRYLPFCVTLRDPQVDQRAHTSVQTVDQAYTRAVALDLLAQRQLAFAKLKQQGVLVLDAPAHQMSNELVEAYLQLKTRSRL